MNILLANMPIEFNKRENLEPPLGISYVAAMLKDMPGVKVYLKDYEVKEFSEGALAKDLDDMGIDILGISFRTASYRSAKEFTKAARGAKKDIFIVAGGHHATAFAKETMEDLRCDAVVMGEGEYSFGELVERLINKSSLEGLSGIAYRKDDGSVAMNSPRAPIEDIDKLPWPARELLDLDDYSVMTILTSRGCPFNCIYCDKGVSTRKVKFRSAEDIFREMKHIVEGLGKKRLYIVDDHFFVNKNRVGLVLERMIAERLPARWVCQARVDGISEDILNKAKAAGCEQIMFGIETGDESELKYMRKSASLAEAEEAVRLTKKAGIAARANFMLGFPISTAGTARNTIRFAGKIKPDIVRFFAVSPLPNTELWDNIYGKGHIPEGIKWEDINFYKPSFDLKSMTRDEVALYVSAGYWHVLKNDFIKEVTINLLPNLVKLLYRSAKTGHIRGNISKSFPRSVNLVVDNMHQIKGRGLKGMAGFVKKVFEVEKTI